MCDVKEQGRQVIEELVRKFEANATEYRSSSYNEAQLRIDFLNPLLRAFGWDLDNRKKYPQHLREVVVEPTIEANEGKSFKKPDYAFHIGTEVKFFIEAKKPSVHVGVDQEAAFQIRQYGFSGNHAIAILSNFDYTIIYGAIDPPRPEDNARIAIREMYSYEELLTKFDEIYNTISRDAVYDGRFDQKFANDLPIEGHRQFDKYFLKQIESWRSTLAIDLFHNNSYLDSEELNFFVQRILNRIIFLRICEDRELERYESLKDLSKKGANYHDLKTMFAMAETKYNSGLFDLLEDPTLDVCISSDILISILTELYYPLSPYTFAVVKAEVLGEIYEQFVAKRIEIDQDHLNFEIKPEVRLNGGIFPTPKYIIDNIVERTLKPLCDKTPNDIASLRIADISCGSGAFLLSAFEYLKNWHIEWYIQDGVENHRGERIYENGCGRWNLTLTEKRRILFNNIFGVDIDEQAVEIAQFGLLLKILEDESPSSVDAFYAHYGMGALPSLDQNIKRGNSLVDHNTLCEVIADPSDELSYIINPFNWQEEFSKIMCEGGFGAIIGNPPYIRIQKMVQYSPEEVRIYQSRESGYTCKKRNFDKYQLFVERSIKLLKMGGRLGYIIPHKFLILDAGECLRRLIANGRYLRELTHFGVQQVFPKSTTYTCLLFLEKQTGTHFIVEHVGSISAWKAGRRNDLDRRELSELSEKPWFFVPPTWDALFKRINDENPKKLGYAVANVFVGVQTSRDDVYVIRPEHEDDQTVSFRDINNIKWKIEKRILRPCLYDVHVDPYKAPKPNAYIIFPYIMTNRRAVPIDQATMRDICPNTLEYLSAHRGTLSQRDLQGDLQVWYRYGRNQSLTKFSGEKIIVRTLSQPPCYSIDSLDLVVTGGGNGPYYLIQPRSEISISNKYLLAILCYPVLEAMVRAKSSHFEGVNYYSHGKKYIKDLPIHILNLDNRVECEIYNRIITLFDRLVELNSTVARTPRRRDVLRGTILDLQEKLFTEIDGIYGVDSNLRRDIQSTFAPSEDEAS